MTNTANRRKGIARVPINPPRAVRLMAIDGTWCRECTMIDASESGAQLEITPPALTAKEFFLLLSFVGQPAFRRCRLVWIDGARIGVTFEKQVAPNAKHKRTRGASGQPSARAATI